MPVYLSVCVCVRVFACFGVPLNINFLVCFELLLLFLFFSFFTSLKNMLFVLQFFNVFVCFRFLFPCILTFAFYSQSRCQSLSHFKIQRIVPKKKEKRKGKWKVDRRIALTVSGCCDSKGLQNVCVQQMVGERGQKQRFPASQSHNEIYSHIFAQFASVRYFCVPLQ